MCYIFYPFRNLHISLIQYIVRVDRKLEPGTKITLKDDRRSIEVEVVADIRPGRTARVAI